MTTLVTGATGFVGTNIVQALLERGGEVVAFGQGDLLACARTEFARHADRLSVVSGDVCDARTVDALFAGRRIAGVVHAAAVTAGPAREARDPSAIVEVNLTGTIRVIEAARRHGAGRIVYVGSGSAYGESLFSVPRLYEDVTPSRPASMYGITKFAAERTALRLGELWSLDLVGVRLGSVFGPWERDTGVRDTLSPHFQAALLAASGSPLRYPEREVDRDYVYSRDVADGVLALLDAPRLAHRLYHLSAGVPWGRTTPLWCAALATVYNGLAHRTARAGEAANVVHSDDRSRGLMDVARIACDAGFRPRFGPEQAYRDYAQWLAAHPDFAK